MAKNPNDSDDQSTPNQVGDFGLSRIAQIANQNRISAEDAADRRRLKDAAGKGINARVEFNEGLPSEARNSLFTRHPELKAKHFRDLADQNRLTNRVRVRAEAAQNRLTSQVVNELGREYSESSINSSINSVANSPEAQQRAMSMTGVPYNDLINQQRKASSRLKTIGEINQALGSVAVNRQGMNQSVYGNIQTNTKEAQGLVSELGVISAALSQQKSLGNDPKSRTSALLQDVAKAQGVSGTDKAYEAAQNLIKSFEKLSEVTDITSNEFKDLQKTTDEARKNFAAAGGDGGRNTRDTFMGYANIAQSGFGAAANAIQQIGVNQRLGQAQNAAEYADFENQKYQTYKAAAGGDIASLMQLSQFSGAEGFGGGLKTASQVAVAAQLAGGITQSSMGAVDIASTLNPVENALSTSAAQERRESGIINVVEGTAVEAVAGSDLIRGVSAGQADLAGRQARLNLSRAVNAVGAEQVQGFRDFSVGMSTAAIGMGSRGEEFLNKSISDSNLNRMASARISPEQMAQMSQMGVASMGSMFNTDQVFTARTNEQRGLGTMQENMQRLSSLSAAGANNPSESLGAITEGAVMKGLDSSKALNAVVDHTASIAAASTGRALGMDTSAAASALLTAGITKDTPNKEAALERSASLQETFNQVGTNANVSFAGMVNTARIGRSTGLGGVSSILASQIDDATLMSMNKDNATAMLTKAGIDVRGKNAPDMVGKLKEDRQMQLLEAGNFGINYDRADTLKRLKSGTALTQDEELGVNQAAGLLGMKTGQKITGDDLKNRILGVNAAVPKESFGPVDVNADKTRASLDKLRTAGFEQLSTAASTAATNLGGAANAIKTLTAAIESLSKEMPGMEKNATTSAGRAAAGGKGMDMNVTGFNTAIDKLDKVLNNVLAKSSLGAGSSDKQRIKAPGP